MNEEHSREKAGQGTGESFELSLQLHWSDMDALGHVNNARIVTLMEEARLRWSRPDAHTGRFEFGLVVASLQVDYLRPVLYRPEILIRVGAVRVGTKSFTVRHAGYVDGEPVFDGTTVMVPLAEDGVSSRALSKPERGWLESSLIQART